MLFGQIHPLAIVRDVDVLDYAGSFQLKRKIRAVELG